MSRNAPPAWAGVRAMTPATRILSGPIGSSDRNGTIPVPRAAAADGEASTGMTVPGPTGVLSSAGPKAPTGIRGKGVSAVSAAYPAGSTAATVSCCPCGACHVVVHTAVLCRTPGTAAIAFCTAGVMS